MRTESEIRECAAMITHAIECYTDEGEQPSPSLLANCEVIKWVLGEPSIMDDWMELTGRVMRIGGLPLPVARHEPTA